MTKDKWQGMTMSEQAEAWEEMTTQERRLVRPSVGRPGKSMTHICKECGRAGQPRGMIKGSVLVEIILWLMFLIPGIIYSIWRLTTKRQGCRHCGGEMIDIDSPRGRALWKQYGAEQ